MSATCGKKLSSKEKLKFHIRTHTGYRHHAYLCTKSFSKKDQLMGDTLRLRLASHRRYMHYEAVTGKPKTKHDCDLCEKKFESMAGLHYHKKRIHSKIIVDTSVICEICGKKISGKGRLIYHLRIHSGDKPFSCSNCPKKFAMKDLLTEHMRVHTGEKPYTCRFCGKPFAHRSPFRYHVKTHTGEKPNVCPICGKGFISLAAMKSHTQICSV
nr:unnamed protein product [Callosobruchus analis]